MQVIEHGDWRMQLLEKYPCSSKGEAEAREQWHIDKTSFCVNKANPGRACTKSAPLKLAPITMQAENQVVTFLATAKKQSDGAEDAPMAKVQALTKRIEEAEDAAPPLKKKKLMTMEEMRAIQRRIDEEEEAQK